MARKPKTQPSTEAAAATPVPELASAPARRGRKPKAATPSPALPLMVGDDERAADTAKGSASKAGPTKTPGRRGPGRQPKQRADAEAATLPQDTAVEQAGATTYPSAAGLEQSAAEDDAPVAERVVPLHEAGADDAGHGGAHAGTEVIAPTASAARWDRVTDAVRFDWPEIERVASATGPNQGMAKLLVAARAEGAGSRWPL